MRTHSIFILINLVFCCPLFSQTIIFSESFDSYITGTGIAGQTLNWQTWTTTTGNAEDALVSEEYHVSGDKSLNIINNNDILFDFGNRVSGAYSVDFNLYIKPGNGAYFNIEHGNRTKFAFQVYFMENLQLWFDNGTDSLQLTSYTAGEWFNLKLFVDLNNDTIILYKNDVVIGGFDFSLAMNTQPQPILGLIDFYGAYNYPPLGITNSNYFIDDFKFIEITPPDTLKGCDMLNYFDFSAQSYNGFYLDLDTLGFVISTYGNSDNANSEAIDIGFTFNFNCQDYTHFILNTNGFIKMGNTPPSSDSLFYSSGNSIEGGIFNSNNPADVNILSPFNHDLIEGSDTAEFRIYTEGESPYRMCTIQFKNLKDKTTSPAQQFENIEFQIRLYETLNAIEFVYGSWIPSTNTSELKTAACGLKGSTISDEDLLTVTKTSINTWYNVSFSNANYATNAFNFGNTPDRPLPDIGMTYRFTPALKNNLKVNEIYALGTASVEFSNPQLISASIGNIGTNVMTDVDVKLEVNGINNFTTFTSTKKIPFIFPKTNVVVTFDPFIAEEVDVNNIIVTLPVADDDIFDNEKYWLQYLTESEVKYSSGDMQDIDWGYNANQGGILLTKYPINQPVIVNSIDAFLTNFSSVGKTVYGVIMDEEGTISGQSNEFAIEDANLYSWHTFEINVPPVLSGDFFYAGLAVPPASTAYYPLGAQVENPCRNDAYFWSPIGGGSIHTSPVRFMIGASLDIPVDNEKLHKMEDNLQLFPNPARDYITISILSNSAVVNIYTASGILVKTFQLNQKINIINISDLTIGIYVIKIKSENELISTKLIKE